MANLQVKRGTDAQRLTITPVVGELIYTTDTKNLYIGDGVTVGGVLTNADILVDGAEAQSLIFSDPLDSSTTSGVSTVSIVPATTSVPGSMSAADKTKLDIVPNTIGLATQVLQVNAGATALEYVNQSGGGSSDIALLTLSGSAFEVASNTATMAGTITDTGFTVASNELTIAANSRFLFNIELALSVNSPSFQTNTGSVVLQRDIGGGFVNVKTIGSGTGGSGTPFSGNFVEFLVDVPAVTNVKYRFLLTNTNTNSGASTSISSATVLVQVV